MKYALLALASLALSSCYTADVGNTLSEINNSCAGYDRIGLQVTELADGRKVATCGVVHSLLVDDVVVSSLSQNDAIALKDEAQCLEFGVEPGTELYFSCRMMLAQIRATEAAAAAQNAQATQAALMNAQAWLQSTQPQRSTTNCTAYTQGVYTHYRCN